MLNLLLPKVSLKLRKDSPPQEDVGSNGEPASPNTTIDNQRRLESTSPSMRKKLIVARRKQTHSRTSSVTFPNGVIPEEYGLPPIDKTTDVDLLQRFEVIRYLDAFNISHNDQLGEEELRMMLKETLNVQ